MNQPLAIPTFTLGSVRELWCDRKAHFPRLDQAREQTPLTAKTKQFLVDEEGL